MNGAVPGDDESKAIVDRLIEQVAADEGLSNSKYFINYTFGKGDNYVGEIKRATIEGVDKDCKKRQIKVIVKKSPPGFNEKGMPVAKYYGCEEFAYKTYFPVLNKLQEDAGIAKESRIKFPKCYASFMERDKEVLIFEDLNEAGYKLTDKFKSFDRDHVRLVIQTQAKYHALAYAFKEQSTEEEYESFREISALKEEINESYFKYVCEIAVKVMDHIVDEDCKTTLAAFIKSDLKGDIYDYTDFEKTTAETPHNLIIHGDSWAYNMLFKYDSNHKVKDMILIDWQLIRMASPVYDIIFTLFICLDEATRDELFQELIDLYYVTLREYLVKLKCDPDKCYPEAVYKKHLTEKMGFALATSILYLPFTLSNKEDSLDMNDLVGSENDEFNASVIKFSDECLARMNGVLRFVKKSKYY